MSVAVRSLIRRRRSSTPSVPRTSCWFRPLYTGGKCPLCGEAAPDGEQSLPLLLRIDRFGLGLAALVVTSVAMAALVLAMYFRT